MVPNLKKLWGNEVKSRLKSNFLSLGSSEKSATYMPVFQQIPPMVIPDGVTTATRTIRIRLRRLPPIREPMVRIPAPLVRIVPIPSHSPPLPGDPGTVLPLSL